MLYFLYGLDTFRSRLKLNEIISQYKKIHKSGLNFYIIDASEADFSEFKRSSGVLSMFPEKKLIIIKELFSNRNFCDELKCYLQKSNLAKDKEVIVIVYEKEMSPGKTPPVFLFLKGRAKSQEFKLLEGANLKKWFSDEVKRYGLSFEKEAAEKLLMHVGNDLWRLNNELVKLSHFSKGEKISKNDVENLVAPEIHNDIFRTIDALAAKNKKLALKLIIDYFNQGGSEFYLLSMIEYQFRNLLKVYKFTNQYKHTNIMADLMKESGMHPYAVKKSLEQAKKFSLDELKRIYDNLFELDLKIKTGQIEPRLGIELFAANID